MSTFPVLSKSAAPSGVSIVVDRSVVRRRRAFIVRAPHFMLEDAVDAALANAALANPENKDRIDWKLVREQLGL
jgi:hypothetical protein